MLQLQQVRQRVLDLARVSDSTTIRLESASGRVLAGEVISGFDYPLFDNSAMDGFAVRSEDVEQAPVSLEVVGVSSAGHPFHGRIDSGQAARILTGAPMVDGADCVVPVEQIQQGPDDAGRVIVLVDPGEGEHVRRRGEIVRSGSPVLARGTQLNPGHLGFLSSLGVENVEVVPAPQVVILSTGDELVGPGSVPGPGQIFESNTTLLSSMLAAMGCDVSVVHARDDIDSIAAQLQRLGTQTDVIISTGGVSMGGEYDALRNAVGSFDVEVVQVAIKPAKPFAFGRVGDALMFGLPGNPASVVVSFELFVRPALRKMAALEPVTGPTFKGVLGADVSRVDDGKTHFIPMRRGDDGRWIRTGTHGSHAVSPFADASAMLAFEPTRALLEEGSQVELIPLWT